MTFLQILVLVIGILFGPPLIVYQLTSAYYSARSKYKHEHIYLNLEHRGDVALFQMAGPIEGPGVTHAKDHHESV